MASSPGNTNPQNPPFDIHKFFKPASNPYPTPPSSYPPPTGPFSPNQYQNQEPAANLHQQRSLSYPTAPLNLPNNPGTQILALINNAGGAAIQDLPHQHPAGQFHGGQVPFPGASVPIRAPSCKLPAGRRLVGDHVVYDVNVRFKGELQPQLEVTPITKYGSDPQLVVGRQIAVNKVYICYGLKGGNIRVLNINTALRSLFRGHTQRVTDMAFFAEDVHLLASVSVEGRIFVWRISEGSEEEDKAPQITGGIALAVQILGDEDAKHPRVCWHCHKQEILVVAIGKCVLRIDTIKAGKGELFSSDSPLQCPIDKPIDGIQLVGKHDGEVTDLSMCQWMTTRLVSSSVDGTIKIWEDRKGLPLAVLRPHDGHPVNSAMFLTAPTRPDHIILITGGPLNREMRIWVSGSEEGWLLPSDSESWKCIQTLDLQSSAESRIEDAFFNQTVALSQAGLLLLANAKKNAIYAVHLDYGSCPAQTRMDYLAEFTVTMPILSFTGTNDPPDEHFVKVYCVQTLAIQQYTLELCQCLPSPLENAGLEKSDSSVSHEMTNVDGFSALESSGRKPGDVLASDSALKPATQITSSDNANALAPSTTGAETISVPSPPLPLSPKLSRRLSGYRAPTNNFEPSPCDHSGKQVITDYSVDRPVDTVGSGVADVTSLDDSTRSEEKKVASDEISVMPKPAMMFKHPTHLVTPSEILMAVSSTDTPSTIKGKTGSDASTQDVTVSNELGSTEVEVKMVGEARSTRNDEAGYGEELQKRVSENKEKVFCSQASDLSSEMARECHEVTEEGYGADEPESRGEQPQSGEVEGRDSRQEMTAKLSESGSGCAYPLPSSGNNRGKKQKGKNSQGSGLPSPSTSAFNLSDSYNEQAQSSSLPAAESGFPQLRNIQEMLNQLMVSQKEMQKQLSNAVNVPIAKEGKRLEAALGRSVEKFVKANTDALWARILEENAKNEKLLRERTQQLPNLVTNLVNKELNTTFEKVVKKEFSAIGPAVVRTITPAIEKTIASAIAESFQRGVSDKAVNQLEKSLNSKLEATVARQIQAQFQTSGRQALQDALKSSLEASVIPAFEMSCKTMFEQIDATFQKGIVEHANAAQQRYESSHSQLALALRDAINSASSVAQSLSGELADGQRKLLALAAAGASSGTVNPLAPQISNGPLSSLLEKVEMPLDPTKELSRLISERKYEEAFTAALQRSDVSIVSWLCSKVDLHGILAMVPLPLSQGVLLSLLQQLACDINKETPRKLAWMTDVAAAINPADQMIALHSRPILEQVYQILHHQRSSHTITGADLSSIRLLMHVINSMLMSCK